MKVSRVCCACGWKGSARQSRRPDQARGLVTGFAKGQEVIWFESLIHLCKSAVPKKSSSSQWLWSVFRTRERASVEPASANYWKLKEEWALLQIFHPWDLMKTVPRRRLLKPIRTMAKHNKVTPWESKTTKRNNATKLWNLIWWTSSFNVAAQTECVHVCCVFFAAKTQLKRCLVPAWCLYGPIPLSQCWCRETISHTHPWCSAHTRWPPLQGQYLQFILFCKITLSQCFTIFLPLPPPPPLPPLSSLPLPPSPACHFRCTLRWLSVIKANYGSFRACRASCGSNTLPAHSCQSSSPSICVSSHLSIPRASTTWSNSFSTQLLHPVGLGMWVNVNLMVRRCECIQSRCSHPEP